MGWTSFTGTIKDVITESIKTQSWQLTNGATNERTCLAKCMRGFTLYAVMQDRLLDSSGVPLPEQPPRPRWILVVLIRRYRDGTVAFKDMDESCGPVEVDCPESYLDMCGDPPRVDGANNWAADWYGKVRAHHAAQHQHAEMLAKVKVGDTLVLRKGCWPERVIFSRKRGRYLHGSGYRVPPKYVASIIPA